MDKRRWINIEEEEVMIPIKSGIRKVKQKITFTIVTIGGYNGCF